MGANEYTPGQWRARKDELLHDAIVVERFSVLQSKDKTIIPVCWANERHRKQIQLFTRLFLFNREATYRAYWHSLAPAQPRINPEKGVSVLVLESVSGRRLKVAFALPDAFDFLLTVMQEGCVVLADARVEVGDGREVERAMRFRFTEEFSGPLEGILAIYAAPEIFTGFPSLN